MFRRFLIILFIFQLGKIWAQDTCQIGIFITDIYDLNLSEKSFTAKFWIWGLYKNDSLKILENMELIEAKEFEFMLATVEKRDSINYAAQKARATFKKDWNIANFPFDKQKLSILVESGDADHSSLVFTVDKKHSNFDSPNIKIEGWKIIDFKTEAGYRSYQTNYGDPNLSDISKYSTFTASITLKRESWGLFFKLFTGLYVAFAISLLPYFMGPENAERFGLLVGSLFAAVANKYVVDSILPDTNDYTLVDKIHVITFLYNLISLIMTVVAYRLYVAEKNEVAKRLDFIAFWLSIISYSIINIYLIIYAL